MTTTFFRIRSALRARGALALSALAAGALSCAATPAPSSAAVATARATSAQGAATAGVDGGAAGGDRLGPLPAAGELPSFRPSAPKVLGGPAGSSIWWFERHELPLIEVAVVVPIGSSADPKGKPGLAYAVGRMLTEGAGNRDAIVFAQALRDIGAKLHSEVTRDTCTISLRVLSSRLGEGMKLLADAVMRPRMAPKDFDRVRILWRNALVARDQDPAEVARTLTPLLYFGPQDPYGHSPEGGKGSPDRISVDDVRQWHRALWRPTAATFVAAGDVSEQALRAALDSAFGAWRAEGTAAAAPAFKRSAPSATTAESVKTAVVDRPDAPQVVLSIAEPGVAADKPEFPRVSMLNLAFGGSFGSRLNQSLRETHGWTYGASSAFAAFRHTGLFLVRAAIRTDATAEALTETLRLAGELGQAPLSADEGKRLRAQVQGDAIMGYGDLGMIAANLARHAGLALPPDHDGLTLDSQLSATPADLLALAREFVRPAPALVVLVGPKSTAEQALKAAGLPAPAYYDVQGNRLAAAKPASASR